MTEKLFNAFNSDLFVPLGGPNRRLYAHVLMALHPLFFERTDAELLPSREQVRSRIDEALAQRSFRWCEEDGAPAVPDGAVGYRIYRRLVETGWLEEESHAYQVKVAIPPPVGLLLSRLMELSRQEKVFYGGRVLSIYNNVKNAVEAPRDHSLALREASRDAHRFQHHLHAMVYGLKALLENVAEIPESQQLLGRFFDDFVADFLVADYKKLKTANNPFRYRHRILELVQRARFEAAVRNDLIQGYRLHMDLPNRLQSEAALDADLLTLLSTFEHIDQHLERIDRFRSRFERRAADAIRYMDRSQPGAAARFSRLIDDFAGAFRHRSCDTQTPWVLTPVPPVGAAGHYVPLPVRKPPPPRPLRQRRIDPQQLAQYQAVREYLSRRRLRVSDVIHYLERHLAGRREIAASQMHIESVADYLAFSRLRRLGQMGREGRIAARRYRFHFSEELIDNGWVRCRGFVVSRR